MCSFPSSVEISMVQLSPSQSPSVAPPSECTEEGQERQENLLVADHHPTVCPPGLLALQLSLETSTVYYGYESYIEDGLICLKHKVRNLEKKKVGWF